MWVTVAALSAFPVPDTALVFLAEPSVLKRVLFACAWCPEFSCPLEGAINPLPFPGRCQAGRGESQELPGPLLWSDGV